MTQGAQEAVEGTTTLKFELKRLVLCHIDNLEPVANMKNAFIYFHHLPTKVPKLKKCVFGWELRDLVSDSPKPTTYLKSKTKSKFSMTATLISAKASYLRKSGRILNSECIYLKSLYDAPPTFPGSFVK